MTPWFIAALTAAVLGAAVLVWLLRWDERLDRTVDPEYHWHCPGIDRLQSVFKLGIRLWAQAVLLAFAGLYLWNALASRTGRTQVPLPFFQLPGSDWPGHVGFHQVALVCVGALFLCTARAGQRLGQAIDDRRMFDALVAWAPEHISRVEARVRGVHLLFHSGLSQMALTYWVRPGVREVGGRFAGSGGYWSRKISLVMPNRTTGRMAEFVFTFGLFGKFTESCRHAHVMDAFALSLEWE